MEQCRSASSTCGRDDPNPRLLSLADQRKSLPSRIVGVLKDRACESAQTGWSWSAALQTALHCRSSSIGALDCVVLDAFAFIDRLQFVLGAKFKVTPVVPFVELFGRVSGQFVDDPPALDRGTSVN